jgi:hypothetical protein
LKRPFYFLLWWLLLKNTNIGAKCGIVQK